MPPRCSLRGRGKGNGCAPWAFVVGIREAGEEVIHAFSSPSSSEGRGDELRCDLGAEITGMGLRPRGRSRQGDAVTGR